MNLSRRTFGLGLIATLAAPAIIRTSGLLMPTRTPPALILWGDGAHDDTEALEWALADERHKDWVQSYFPTERLRILTVPKGRSGAHFLTSRPVQIFSECDVVEGAGSIFSGPWTAECGAPLEDKSGLPLMYRMRVRSTPEQVWTTGMPREMAERYIHDLGALVRV